MLDKIIQEKLSELDKLLAKSKLNYKNNQPDLEEPDPYFVTFFEHLALNKIFYHTMFTKMNSSGFYTKMFETIRESFFNRISSMEMEHKVIVSLDIFLG